ncbi:MAG: 16S rRNA (cytidine(1402)-2'-O)-methyltransferase [Bacteroidales bacterium]|nr:16S rRNA (cytidine(1402)-2'-O)-methyltransferase [Bacteroidales bacterium]
MSKLYLVPTPVGNLEDITFRAVRILREVDLILCEDTRKTSVLLKHYQITNKVKSHHQFNEHRTLNQVIRDLKSGMNIALVTDAGTPSVSDPGFLVVRECINNHIQVECLPGPVALIPALVISGFPTDSFCFEGFLPHKKRRQTLLKKLSEEKRTVILYESPHRLLKTLRELAVFMGPDQKMSVSRELTKIHEETRRGSVSELIEYYESKPVKGEIVIVIGPKSNTGD